MKKTDESSMAQLDGQLLDAVIANDVQAVTELLEKGANPNCFEDHCQIRPLHFACVYNAKDVVFPLIQAGASISARTADNHRAIDLAQQFEHHEIIKILTALSTNLLPFKKQRATSQ